MYCFDLLLEVVGGSVGRPSGRLLLTLAAMITHRSRRGASEEGSQSLRLHAALVAKREAEVMKTQQRLGRRIR